MCLVLMPFFSFILYIVRNDQQTVSKPKLYLLDDDPDYPIWKVLKKTHCHNGSFNINSAIKVQQGATLSKESID